MLRRLRFGLTAVSLLFVLAGCVTTVEHPGQIKIDPKRAAEEHIKLGMTYLQKNQRDGALRAFSRAMELDKNAAEAHQGMAMVHQLNGETKLAEESFKKALRLRADFSKAGIQFAYGRFLLEQKRYDEALEQFRHASSDITYPSRSGAIYYSGLCELQHGETVKAKAFFEHALTLNARLSGAALELADMAYEARDYASAKRYLDVFEQNSSKSPRSLFLGIKIERIFANKDKEASYALALKNLHPYSKEYLEYKTLMGGAVGQ